MGENALTLANESTSATANETNNETESTLPSPGFEGPEKNLEIDFVPESECACMQSTRRRGCVAYAADAWQRLV